MSDDDGEALALNSIAEVITEARALVRDSGDLDYNQALIDLTMARLRPDVAFLILGGDEVEVEVVPSNGTLRAPFALITLGASGQPKGRVVHSRENCSRLARSRHGYRQATMQEYLDLDWCLRCRP